MAHQGRLKVLQPGQNIDKPETGHSNIFVESGTNNLILQDEKGGQVRFVPVYTPFGANLGGNVPTQVLGAKVLAVSLGWNYNKSILSQSINGEVLAVDTRAKEYDFSNNPITADVNFNLNAARDGEATGANWGIHFANWRFWGVGPAGAASASAITLAGQDLTDSRNIGFTVTAGANEKIYYLRPARFGAGTYNVGGFEGGFDERQVTITNENGYTEEYFIGESTNPGLGKTTVNIY